MKQVPCAPNYNCTALKVTENTTLKWTYQGTTYERTVPAGYEFRPGAGVEVTITLAAVLKPYALLTASCLHEYLYDEIESRPKDAVPRVVADEALRSDESDPEWIREPAYHIVRFIGWMPWLDGTD
jgi:hypothetical protein